MGMMITGPSTGEEWRDLLGFIALVLAVPVAGYLLVETLFG